jgi:hypothetical protein
MRRAGNEKTRRLGKNMHCKKRLCEIMFPLSEPLEKSRGKSTALEPGH